MTAELALETTQMKKPDNHNSQASPLQFFQSDRALRHCEEARRVFRGDRETERIQTLCKLTTRSFSASTTTASAPISEVFLKQRFSASNKSSSPPPFPW